MANLLPFKFGPQAPRLRNPDQLRRGACYFHLSRGQQLETAVSSPARRRSCGDLSRKAVDVDLHRELMNLHTELGKSTKKIPIKVKVQVVEACSLVVNHVPDECLIDTFKGMQSMENLKPIRANVLHEIKSYARDNNNFGETRRMVEHMMRAEKFLSIPTRSLMAAPIKEALRLVGKASS